MFLYPIPSHHPIYKAEEKVASKQISQRRIVKEEPPTTVLLAIEIVGGRPSRTRILGEGDGHDYLVMFVGSLSRDCKKEEERRIEVIMVYLLLSLCKVRLRGENIDVLLSEKLLDDGGLQSGKQVSMVCPK